MDVVTPDRRSENMRRIHSKNTGPELTVRRFVHGKGLRFRPHPKGMPGKPDLCFPSRRVCIFVHGCFWHGCERCIDGQRRVKSNRSYWENKIRTNRMRDLRNAAKLRADGWKVFVIWECQTKNPSALQRLVKKILDQTVR
jgi:DNA mismatch endonuclease (patch repair protein)